MKKIILLSLLFVTTIFAQDESQSQSIELPDFVITGKESISIRKIQKSYPDFIPLLSSDFFTPQYPAVEQTTIKLPELNTEIVSVGNYKQKTNAILKVQAGLETFPFGDFYISDWKDNFSYNAHLFGRNELEFVNKAGLSIAGAGVGGKYFLDHDSEFLPGLEISFNGKYVYDSFNFYGSNTPNLERSTDNGYVDLSFNYTSNPNNKFGLNLADSYYNQKDDEISENIFGISAYTTIAYKNFNINIEGNYKNQTTSSVNLSPGNQYYFSSLATLGFVGYDIINIKAGVYLAEREGNTFFAPHIYGSLKLNNSISLFGEFAPNTEFLTLQNFKSRNRYYKLNNFVNKFIENNFNLKFALKYEYEKYFEVSGGVGYVNSDNNFYFEDNINNGFFSIYSEDMEHSYIFLNFLFRKGPFGQFYADLKIQDISMENDNRLPYSSTFITSLNYLYDWSNGFGLKLGLDYSNESYTDYENSNTLPEVIDLNASFYYQFITNFKLTLAFENLLNQDYYYFRNYDAKPFDILAGFEFRW